MAHGTGRLNACFSCEKYIWVSRFSKNPTCSCGKESQQTTSSEMIDKFHLWGGYSFGYPSDWRKITSKDKRP